MSNPNGQPDPQSYPPQPPATPATPANPESQMPPAMQPQQPYAQMPPMPQGQPYTPGYAQPTGYVPVYKEPTLFNVLLDFSFTKALAKHGMKLAYILLLTLFGVQYLWGIIKAVILMSTASEMGNWGEGMAYVMHGEPSVMSLVYAIFVGALLFLVKVIVARAGLELLKYVSALANKGE